MDIPHVKAVPLAKPHIKDPNDVRFLSLFDHWNPEKEYDAGFLGVPSDVGSLGRKGSSHGPSAIREALTFISTFSPPDIDLSKKHIAYLGDLETENADVESVGTYLYEALIQLIPKLRRIVVLGGDHSITAPSIKALHHTTERKCGLIYVDSHLDLRGGAPSSGNGIRRAIESGAVSPHSVVNIGARPYANSSKYWQMAISEGIHIIDIEEVKEIGAHQAARQALDYLYEPEVIYASFDMDSVDISHAPAVSSPSPGGLTAREAFQLVSTIGGDPRLRIFDLTEVAPPLDLSNITSVTAAYLLVNLLGSWLR